MKIPTVVLIFAATAVLPAITLATEASKSDSLGWRRGAGMGPTFQESVNQVSDDDNAERVRRAGNVRVLSNGMYAETVTDPELLARIRLEAVRSSSPLRTPSVSAAAQSATGANGNATASSEYVEYFVHRAGLKAAAASFMVVVLYLITDTLLRRAARIKKAPNYVGEEKPYVIYGMTAVLLGAIGLAFALYSISDYMVARHNPVMYAATHMSEIRMP